MRAATRALAELVLCASGAPRIARARRGGRALVLAYHDIVPEGSPGYRGDASLHLAQADFGRQLDLLARTHDIVPLSAVLESAATRRPRAVITFDDAYEGALTAGVAELARRGLQATVFVAPAFLGGHDFWWDALSGDDGLSPALRAHALGTLGGQDARIRAWAAAQGLPERRPPAHMRAASEERLAAAAAAGVVALASHTWSHPALPGLAAEELRAELERPLAWLRERFSGVLPWLTYPYGATSPEVARAARAAGYVAALRVDGGWMSSAADAFDLPRLNVPAGVSVRGFELRTAGVLGDR